MKDFSRIIPKQGFEAPVGKSAEDIIKDGLEGKYGSCVYSDYHGVGILDTKKFIVVHGTFPTLTEEKRVKICG